MNRQKGLYVVLWMTIAFLWGLSMCTIHTIEITGRFEQTNISSNQAFYDDKSSEPAAFLWYEEKKLFCLYMKAKQQIYD